MNQYKLTFIKVKNADKRIVQDWEYHIFSDINACLNWLKRDLSVSCMPYFDIERVNNKLIRVYYNDKLTTNNDNLYEYFVEITRLRNVDNNRQIERYKQKGFSDMDIKGISNLVSMVNGA